MNKILILFGEEEEYYFRQTACMKEYRSNFHSTQMGIRFLLEQGIRDREVTWSKIAIKFKEKRMETVEAESVFCSPDVDTYSAPFQDHTIFTKENRRVFTKETKIYKS